MIREVSVHTAVELNYLGEAQFGVAVYYDTAHRTDAQNIKRFGLTRIISYEQLLMARDPEGLVRTLVNLQFTHIARNWQIMTGALFPFSISETTTESVVQHVLSLWEEIKP